MMHATNDFVYCLLTAANDRSEEEQWAKGIVYLNFEIIPDSPMQQLHWLIDWERFNVSTNTI